jgi:minor histocompatibility antigen H13
MITVATKLDVPIKLSFQSASRSSMLGLGDIVIPGMVICLALRFDHWLHYHRQIKTKPVDLKKTLQDGSGAVTTASAESEPRFIREKPTYSKIDGSWADWFWTSTWWELLSSGRRIAPSVAAASFKKPYFYAAMTGYTLGMLVTLAMLVIFKHGQPALLYLVPGVLGSLWMTGLVRGEIHEMWTYTEDGSLDTTDVVVEVDKDGNVLKETKKEKPADDQKAQGSKEVVLDTPETKSSRKGGKRRHVFLLSIEAPGSETEDEGSGSSDGELKEHED